MPCNSCIAQVGLPCERSCDLMFTFLGLISMAVNFFFLFLLSFIIETREVDLFPSDTAEVRQASSVAYVKYIIKIQLIK